jgi:hypothetical protein
MVLKLSCDGNWCETLADGKCAKEIIGAEESDLVIAALRHNIETVHKVKAVNVKAK